MTVGRFLNSEQNKFKLLNPGRKANSFIHSGFSKVML